MIFKIYLRAEAPAQNEPGAKPARQANTGDLKPAYNWKLKGVALLCCKD